MPKKFDNTKTQILEQEKVIKREEINSSSSQISPIQRNFCTPSSIQLFSLLACGKARALTKGTKHMTGHLHQLPCLRIKQ
ncbi:hypothetical protein DsansV1_C26g0196441 [Dioscorea sansibarensis]